MGKITRKMYKKAMELRVPLLHHHEEVVLASSIPEDYKPKVKSPVETDDGHGAYRGRGGTRPVGGASVATRVQGSMPRRSAIAVEIKQVTLRNREYEYETGKIVPNRLPSEHSHHTRYGAAATRTITLFSRYRIERDEHHNGYLVADSQSDLLIRTGKGGRILKVKQPARAKRPRRQRGEEFVLVEVS